jgi:RimJ/RimL family protein N-acetyltransferase
MDHISSVTLRPVDELSDTEVERLTTILNQDSALRHWLGMENAPAMAPEEFRRIAVTWQKEKHARTFIIYAQEAIGSISVSHIRENGTARIGYWIASKAWNQGVGTAAFALALEQARQLGIHQVSANIQAENFASLRIWQKWGAEEEKLSGNRVQVILNI